MTLYDDKAQGGSALLTGGGVTVSLADLMLAVKTGAAADVARDILVRRIAASLAMERGLAADDAEVDDAADIFYADRDLGRAEQIADWLGRVKLRDADVRQMLREQLLGEKLKQALFPADTVRARFEANVHDYTTASVEVAIFSSEGVAEETKLALHEQEMTWDDAIRASEQCLHRELTRRIAPEEIAAELFAGEPGALVGPVETEDDRVALYRLTSKNKPILDEALGAQIRDELMEDLLSRRLAEHPVQMLL